MAASPKSPMPSALGAPGGTGSVTSPVLTAPSELVPLSATRLPQLGRALAEKHWLAVFPSPVVNHVRSPSVGVLLPPKS
jgi:hypothetical protein